MYRACINIDSCDDNDEILGLYILLPLRNYLFSIDKNYTRFDDVLQALLDGEVKGMLMDAYEAGTKAKEFEKRGKGRIRVQKVFNYASTFGVVLAGPSTRLYQCSREWMSANRAEMSVHIARYMGVVEVNTKLMITTVC